MERQIDGRKLIPRDEADPFQNGAEILGLATAGRPGHIAVVHHNHANLLPGPFSAQFTAPLQSCGLFQKIDDG